MRYEAIADGHKWTLNDGAVIQLTDIDISLGGIIQAGVKVLLEDGVVGGGRITLSDPTSRFRLAQSIANKNGGNPQIWDDHLLSIYERLDFERQAVSSEPFSPVWLHDQEEPPPPLFTVDKIVPENMTTTFYGDSGQGKSTIVDYLAVCIATGTPFLGFDVIQGKVCLLDWELDINITLWRIYQICRGLGLDRPPKNLAYQTLYTPLKNRLPDIKAWAEHHNPELFILDSFGPASGGDPMDQKLATELMTLVRYIPAARMLVDHQANPVAGRNYATQRAFGSAWKTHLTRSSLQIEAVANVPGKLSAVIRQQKTNFGPKVGEIPLHIRFDGPAIRIERGNPNDQEFRDASSMPVSRRVEAFLKDNQEQGWTVDQIAKEVDAEVRTVRNKLNDLKKRAKVDGQKLEGQKEVEWWYKG